MTGREILNKMKEKVGLSSSSGDTGKGKSKMSKHVTHGYHLVKGKSYHDMEDYVFAQFKNVDDNELGLFAIFDGHLSHEVPDYLRSHLFDNILNEPDFWTEPEHAIRKAYRITDKTILDKAVDLGKGGSTAVTAILINCKKLVVANVGDSRAVICKNGLAKQLSIDHEPSKERKVIEDRGGFVSTFPGDVPRVDGRLAVARAFGDKSLKEHLSSEPDVSMKMIDDDTEFIILASDGVWKVMSNQEAVDCIKNVKDARAAAKQLTDEALTRKSTDDISCVVVRFH
nr:probable protein phosphatase 2C 39 [Tanacetum cinerariifolium]